MTRMHMPAPVIVHALRRDTDLPHQDRHAVEERRHADLVFEMWHRGRATAPYLISLSARSVRLPRPLYSRIINCDPIRLLISSAEREGTYDFD